MPEERTYFPFLEKATEQTGALSCAWRKVATHLLETPSQILMLPSVEPLTKCLPVLFHLRLVMSPVWWWEVTELTKHCVVLTSYILMTGVVVPVTTERGHISLSGSTRAGSYLDSPRWGGRTYR